MSVLPSLVLGTLRPHCVGELGLGLGFGLGFGFAFGFSNVAQCTVWTSPRLTLTLTLTGSLAFSSHQVFSSVAGGS